MVRNDHARERKVTVGSGTRLTASWEAEYRNFQRRSLKDRDYVYVWADGIHVNIRLEEDPLCLLVLIGGWSPRAVTAAVFALTYVVLPL